MKLPNPDKTLGGLLSSLSEEVSLDDESANVITAQGTIKLQDHQPESDRLAAIEDFAGWSTALDPVALAVRGRVLDLIEQWLPSASEAFSSGTFPADLFRELGSAGAIAASLVGRNGNPPLSKIATCAIMHAIEYGDGGLRCALTVHDCVIQALVRFGSNEQKDHWLDSLLSGNRVAAFALTEPNAGSDIRAISTKATRSGEDWILSGSKRWELGPLPRFDISLTKRSNCTSALEVARMARAILGAKGFDLDEHVMRHLLKLEASYSYGGTCEIHGLVVGKELTRESAF